MDRAKEKLFGRQPGWSAARRGAGPGTACAPSSKEPVFLGLALLESPTDREGTERDNGFAKVVGAKSAFILMTPAARCRSSSHFPLAD